MPRDEPDACPKYWGLYDGEEPVGFVMISDNIPPERTEYLGPYFLWRLLIDTRFQGRGLRYCCARPGRRLRQAASQRRHAVHVARPDPGPASPLRFYLKYGFVLTGEIHDDEPVLALALRIQTRLGPVSIATAEAESSQNEPAHQQAQPRHRSRR